MVNFKISYVDGSSITYENVTEARYVDEYGDPSVVSQEDLAFFSFPLDSDLWLYSEAGSISISGDGMRAILVSVK